MPESYIAVGKSLPRIDGVDKVTGSAKYAADIRLDNMLHAKLLRSPHAHAKVKGIDTAGLRHPWQSTGLWWGSCRQGGGNRGP
jgi:CO/xanthine dehydrogenase Mo-binding subunit